MYDPEPILRVLVRHGARFVVIGGIAGALHGSTSITYDLDICYSREPGNLRSLAAALQELDAGLRGVDTEVPFKLDARSLRSGLNFTFKTKFGPFDCVGEASGGFAYEQLKESAEGLDVSGVNISVASLDDLIRMKRAAGRRKDLIEVENLAALRAVREGRSDRARRPSARS